MKNYKNIHYWKEKEYNFEEYKNMDKYLDKNDFINYLKCNAREIKYHRNVKEIKYLIIHEKNCELLYLLQNAKKIVILVNKKENNKTTKIIKKLLKINPNVKIVFVNINTDCTIYVQHVSYKTSHIRSGLGGFSFSN